MAIKSIGKLSKTKKLPTRTGRFGRAVNRADFWSNFINIAKKTASGINRLNAVSSALQSGNFLEAAQLFKTPDKDQHTFTKTKVKPLDTSVGDLVKKFSFRNFDKRNATVNEKLNVLRSYTHVMNLEFDKIQKNTKYTQDNVSAIDQTAQQLVIKQKQLENTFKAFQRQKEQQNKFARKTAEGESEFTKLSRPRAGIMAGSSIGATSAFTPIDQKQVENETILDDIKRLATGYVVGTAIEKGLGFIWNKMGPKWVASAIGNAAIAGAAGMGAAATRFLNLGWANIAKTAGLTAARATPYAAIAALMANEDNTKQLQKDLDAAKTDIEKLRAETNVRRKADNLVTRTNKEEVVKATEHTIKKMQEEERPPFEIAKTMRSRMKAKFVGATPDQRQQIVSEFLSDIKALNLSKTQHDQLMTGLSTGYMNYIDKYNKKQEKAQRRNRRKSKGPMAGPGGDIGAKGPMDSAGGGPKAAGMGLIQEVRSWFNPTKTNNLKTSQMIDEFSYQRQKTIDEKKRFLMFGDLTEGFRIKSHTAASPGNIAPGRFQRFGQGGYGFGGGGGGGWASPGTYGNDRGPGSTRTDPDAWRKTSDGQYLGVSPGPGAPKNVRDPVLNLGKATADDFDISVGKGGKVDPKDVYRKYLVEIEKSKLVGYVPKDGEKFGITTGSAEEWASFYTQLAKQESNFNVNVRGDGGQSLGLMQMKGGQYGIKNPFDPNEAIKGAIKQGEKYILASEHIAGRGQGGVKEGVYKGYRGAAAYFGPLRRQNEFFQHNKWMQGLKGELASDPRIRRTPKGGVDFNDPEGLKSARAILARAYPQQTSKSTEPLTTGAGDEKSIERVSSDLRNRLRSESTQSDRLFYSQSGKSPFNWYKKNPRQFADFLGVERITPRDVKGALVTVRTRSGKTARVNRNAAKRIKPFLDELEMRGYKINQLEGQLWRNVRGGSSLSTHSFGGTIDINPSNNPMSRSGKTDMPLGVRELAALYGLAQLGNDKMHFEVMPPENYKAAVLRLLQRGIIGQDHPQVQEIVRQGIIKQTEIEEFPKFGAGKEKEVRIDNKIKPAPEPPRTRAAEIKGAVPSAIAKSAESKITPVEIKPKTSSVPAIDDKKLEMRQDAAAWQVPNPRLAQEAGMTKVGQDEANAEAQKVIEQRRSDRLMQQVKETQERVARRREIIDKEREAARSRPGPPEQESMQAENVRAPADAIGPKSPEPEKKAEAKTNEKTAAATGGGGAEDAYSAPRGGGRYNPESEPESTGTGGYGSYGKCWV